MSEAKRELERVITTRIHESTYAELEVIQEEALRDSGHKPKISAVARKILDDAVEKRRKTAKRSK
jgi:hypothetical protein